MLTEIVVEWNTDVRSFVRPLTVFHIKFRLLYGHHVKEHKNYIRFRKTHPLKTKQKLQKIGFGTFCML